MNILGILMYLYKKYSPRAAALFAKAGNAESNRYRGIPVFWLYINCQ